MKKKTKIKQLSIEECKQILGGNSLNSNPDLDSIRGGWYRANGASGGVLFYEYSVAQSKPTPIVQVNNVTNTFSPC